MTGNGMTKEYWILLLLLFGGAMAQGARTDRLSQSLLRINVTRQAYDFVRPWEKESPSSRNGIGAVISGGRILVTASLVENATYLELERIDGSANCPASVVQVDYGANLAVLKPNDAGFIAGVKPLRIHQKTCRIGDAFEVFQFESNGTAVVAEAELKETKVHPYPYSIGAYLVFQLKVTLASVGNSFTLPVFYKGRLVGLTMGHNQGNQTVSVLPAPVINHFIADLDDGDYDGFPMAGFSFKKLDEPPLRRHLGVAGDTIGIFIDTVRPSGGAAAAGLMSGDVLLGVDAYNIDNSGQYTDPNYGKLSLSHLLSTRSFTGDVRIFRIHRDRETLLLPVTLSALRPEHYPVEPISMDKAPEYIIAGGLVFQELTRQYLKAWRGNWSKAAPNHFLHYEKYQWDLIAPGDKLVILSQVIPAAGNVGYDDLRYLVVTSVNNRSITRLSDIAEALLQPVDGFHRFEFQEDPHVVIMDADTLDRENRHIQERYGLPSLSRLVD